MEAHSGASLYRCAWPHSHRRYMTKDSFCSPKGFFYSHPRGIVCLLSDRSVVSRGSSSSSVLCRVAGISVQRKNHFSLHRIFFHSTKQHSENSSFVEESQKEATNYQNLGENGPLSSSPPSSVDEISEEVFSKTRRLVETAMLAAAAGLAYFLSNTFRIENYFGCFFPLPLVISSLRWGVAAGRKTMVATAMLLLVLSGPLKAATYLLMHGSLGLTMGTLWRAKVHWAVSLLICTLVRSLGAMGFVFLSSWLIRDNILALITINAHASISLMLAAVGVSVVPSMGSIYFIFGILVLLNCGTLVVLLHVLYAIFLKRLGIPSSLVLPAWLKGL